MFDAWVHMKVDETALNRIDVGCNEHANPQREALDQTQGTRVVFYNAGEPRLE